MRMSGRKLVLTVHLVVSVGWIGTAMAYLALSVAAAAGRDPQVVRAAWIAKDVIGWYVIVPLALGTLASGVLLSVVTPWGLIRHYWVLFSFLLTLFSVAVLLLRMPAVSVLARVAKSMPAVDLSRLEADLLHPGAGLLVLLGIATLNVYKPRGMTPYGWRKQQEDRLRRRQPGGVAPPEAAPPPPRG